MSGLGDMEEPPDINHILKSEERGKVQLYLSFQLTIFLFLYLDVSFE